MSRDFSIYKRTNNFNDFYKGYYKDLNIPFDETDYFVIIPSEYEYKPGNMAYAIYGNPELFWVFTYFNRDLIDDPIYDFKSGLIIKVPTQERLFSCLR